MLNVGVTDTFLTVGRLRVFVSVFRGFSVIIHRSKIKVKLMN